jgi:hypothetical protein
MHPIRPQKNQVKIITRAEFKNAQNEQNISLNSTYEIYRPYPRNYSMA